MHWIPDVVVCADGSRVRAGYAGENVALIRRVAVSLLRRVPGKGSTPTKRLKAGWNDEYVLQVLQGIQHFRSAVALGGFVMPDTTVKKLRDAVGGLRCVSEKDALWEAFEWDAKSELTADRVRELGGHPKSAKVSESGFREFLEPLTREADWHEEKEQVRRYKALLSLFEKEVTEPRVFRVGKDKASYYLVGKSRSGNWVGVKTEATET